MNLKSFTPYTNVAHFLHIASRPPLCVPCPYTQPLLTHRLVAALYNNIYIYLTSSVQKNERRRFNHRCYWR